ncbi:hypothetical protein ABH966_001332 [Lysinibacillus sp. RC46]
MQVQPIKKRHNLITSPGKPIKKGLHLITSLGKPIKKEYT